MLALPCSDVELGNEKIVLNSISIMRKNVEQAGVPFEQLLGTQRSDKKEEKEVKEEEMIGSDNEENIDFDNLKKKKRKQSWVDKEGKNYYEVLELPSRHLVTEDIVRKQYRKLALKYHPDKHKDGEYAGTAKQKWLKISNAYEVLMDLEKRRRYDSLLEFNDTVPVSFNRDKEDFFSVFKQSFERNSYWSKQQPVPDIGDIETDIKKVLKFYEFWDKFDSWREFVHDDEYDVEQAETRYERRYMEKENKKLKNQMYKKERQRIRGLVNLAYENDPRVRKMIEEEEKEKERRRELKRKAKEEKKKQEQDRKRKIKEEEERVKLEKAKKEEEAKQKKLQIKKDRANLEKEISGIFLEKLKKGNYDQFYLEGIFEKMTMDLLQQLMNKLKENEFKQAEDFDNYIKHLIAEKKAQNQKNYNNLKKKEPKKEVKAWTTKDLSLLSKALIKYPAGTPSRWDRIAFYLNNMFTEQEIAEKVKEMKENPIGKQKKKKGDYNVDSNNNTNQTKDKEKWTQEQQKQLENAIKTTSAKLPPKERWTKIAELVDGKSMSDCVKRFKEIKEKMKNKTKKG